MATLRWQRMHPGYWWVQLTDDFRRRHFWVERTTKRSWSVYLADDDTGREVCVFRDSTWHNCRSYVDGYYQEWLSHSQTIRSARGVKSINAST
jgi:hypothetical protein